ncbi:MAG: hypothetical protein KDK41_16995 [Leptospiraceae bacterium]|nr:hypothetical protein [Leptospiraceae bacterium]
MESRVTDYRSPQKFSRLFKSEWLPRLKELYEHKNAPIYNSYCGDRLQAEDLPELENLNKIVRQSVGSKQNPDDHLIDRVRSWMYSSKYIHQKVSSLHLKHDWQKIERMERHHLQNHMSEIIPENLNLNRLVFNSSSGTTGQVLYVPFSPVGVASYNIIMRNIMSRYGIVKNFSNFDTAAVQLCFQQSTMTYATLHSEFNGAAFAKINLNLSDWKAIEDIEKYLHFCSPIAFTGDPFAFEEYMRRGLSFKPQIILSTALELSSQSKNRLQEFFQNNIVNIYSSSETGIIAVNCPLHFEKMHAVHPKSYIEIVDSQNRPVIPDGKHRGTILISGGLNEFVPLLRYNTKDSAAYTFENCACGYSGISLFEISGRAVVVFKDKRDQKINSIDFSRLFRNYPILSHQVTQKADYSFDIVLDSVSSKPLHNEDDLRAELFKLTGGLPLSIKYGISRKNGKFLPFISQIDV